MPRKKQTYPKKYGSNDICGVIVKKGDNQPAGVAAESKTKNEKSSIWSIAAERLDKESATNRSSGENDIESSNSSQATPAPLDLSLKRRTSEAHDAAAQSLPKKKKQAVLNNFASIESLATSSMLSPIATTSPQVDTCSADVSSAAAYQQLANMMALAAVPSLLSGFLPYPPLMSTLTAVKDSKPSSASIYPQQASASTKGSTPLKNCLDQLSSLVHKVGEENSSSSCTTASTSTATSCASSLAAPGKGVSFQELWLKYVKKEENAEMKRLNDAKQIFTCLQCRQSFQTMDKLTKHMQLTQHFANIPKHYSLSMQYAKQKIRQMRVKMKYADRMMYYCYLCQNAFSEPVQTHFSTVHLMHNAADDNMHLVQVIPMAPAAAAGPPAADEHSTLLSKSTTDLATAQKQSPTNLTSDRVPVATERKRHGHSGNSSSNTARNRPAAARETNEVQSSQVSSSTKTPDSSPTSTAAPLTRITSSQVLVTENNSARHHAQSKTKTAKPILPASNLEQPPENALEQLQKLAEKASQKYSKKK